MTTGPILDFAPGIRRRFSIGIRHPDGSFHRLVECGTETEAARLMSSINQAVINNPTVRRSHHD